MMYWQLEGDIEPRIVGTRDGLGPGILDDDFYKRHPWYEKLFVTDQLDQSQQPPIWWQPWATMPDYGQPLVRIPLEKRAKLTDFVDLANLCRGYLVNDRLREMLEQAHLPRHRYFPANFQQNGQEIGGYWWLCYDMETGKNHVDFARSEYQRDPFDQEPQPGYLLGIHSYNDYLAYFNEHRHALTTSSLRLKPSFDQQLDIWGTQFLTSAKGYISSRLLKLFEQHRITGHWARRPKCALEFE